MLIVIIAQLKGTVSLFLCQALGLLWSSRREQKSGRVLFGLASRWDYRPNLVSIRMRADVDENNSQQFHNNKCEWEVNNKEEESNLAVTILKANGTKTTINKIASTTARVQVGSSETSVVLASAALSCASESHRDTHLRKLHAVSANSINEADWNAFWRAQNRNPIGICSSAYTRSLDGMLSSLVLLVHWFGTRNAFSRSSLLRNCAMIVHTRLLAHSSVHSLPLRCRARV